MEPRHDTTHSKRPQALLVIGMHRSGTSALTRAINLHGAVLGTKLMAPTAANVAGYWENQHVVDLHDRLLASLGSSWDDPRELPAGWLDEAVSAGYREQLVSVLASEFGDARMWAVKDPRLCRLLPLWLIVLEQLGVEPKLIFALRHPLEVAGSLKHRDGASIAIGCLLWLEHLAESVRASRALSRCAVDYDEVLSDWRSCMTRIASTLAIDWPVTSEACAAEVDAHVRRDLRHQHSTATADALPVAWRDLFSQIYAAARSLTSDDSGWSRLEAELDAAMAQLAFVLPLAADVPNLTSRKKVRDAHEEELHRVRTQLHRTVEAAALDADRARDEIARVRTELELLRSSLSWRITRPIRVVRSIWARDSDAR